MISKWLGGVLVLSASAMLAAQSPSRYPGASERVVSGTIKTAVALPAADGSVGVHLDLRTAEGMVDVHVAALVPDEHGCVPALRKITRRRRNFPGHRARPAAQRAKTLEPSGTSTRHRACPA